MVLKSSSPTPSTLHKKRKAKTNPNKVENSNEEENSNENSNGNKGKRNILKEDILNSGKKEVTNANKDEISNKNSNSKSKRKKNILKEEREDDYKDDDYKDDDVVQGKNFIEDLMSKYCMENIFDNSDTENSDEDDEIGAFDYSFKLSDRKDSK